MSTGDAGRVRSELTGSAETRSGDNAPEWGLHRHFYLIQLEPRVDPGRFKLGFASNPDERLRARRTAAPLARVVGTWPCRSAGEDSDRFDRSRSRAVVGGRGLSGAEAGRSAGALLRVLRTDAGSVAPRRRALRRRALDTGLSKESPSVAAYGRTSAGPAVVSDRISVER